MRGSRSATVGYVAAAAAPIAITLLVAKVPPLAFVFEHLIVLVVLAIAVRWGIRASLVAAVVAVFSDNVLLREPIGRPTITGIRDVVDLGLFLIVAAVAGGLVATARSARDRAQDAAERERRAREDRDRLIATVSHDLGTPLAVLSGTLEFVRRSGANVQADLPRLFTRLERATARATSLVRTLADAQAMEMDGFVLRTVAIDLRTLVAPIVDMMDRLSERHPVALATPEAPVMVVGDPERLRSVVENLINNAIKYSPDGGAVEVTLALEEGQAVLAVRDYGIGISQEAQARIFERSYRAPEAAAVAPGLGLGLNIAAQIVAHHGGTMQARSAQPQGAIMLLRLPVARPDAGDTSAVNVARA